MDRRYNNSPHNRNSQNVPPKRQSQYFNRFRNPSEPNPEDLSQNNPGLRARQISRFHPDFSVLEYKLRMSLGSISTNLVRAYGLHDRSEALKRFKKQHEGKTLIESWIDASRLHGENSLEKVLSRGFVIPEYGMRISSGAIELSSQQQDPEEVELEIGTQAEKGLVDDVPKQFKSKKLYKLLHLVVCVGKSFVVEAKEGQVVIPYGYDSIYLQPEEETNAYHHKYVVFDPKKIFTDYMVYLEYSPDADEQLKEEIEDQIENKYEEDENSSSSNPFGNVLQKSQQDFLKEAYEKVIRSMDANVQNALETSQTITEVDGDHLENIKQQLAQIDDRREQVCRNASECEKFLRETFKRALLNLHDITQLKLSKLCSTEVELMRRIDEIEWMNEFLGYQRDFKNPMAFLESYSTHTKLLGDKMKDINGSIKEAEETLQQVIPDISANGTMSVSSETEEITQHMRQNKQIVLLNQVNKVDSGDINEKEGITINDEELLRTKDCSIM